MHRVTISIVSHGHGTLVSALLRDLSRQTIARELHVVLTLNVPEAPPEPAACGVLTVRIIGNPVQKGFSANHNAALAEAQTPWVIILNPDIRIADQRLIERLITNNPGAGVVAPVIRNSNGGREDSVRHNLDPFTLLGRKLWHRRALVDSAASDGRFRWVAGMFMALPLASWRRVGGFDERFFLYCEDYDLCARVAEAGGTIVVDESVEAVHDAQRASRRSMKFMRWHLASMLRVWASPTYWHIWASDLRALTGHGRNKAKTSSSATSHAGPATASAEIEL
jgi:GT2 family glycosyltransferase